MSSRQEELENKGWKHLNGDERAELQALRGTQAPQAAPVETPKVDVNEERIRKLEEMVGKLSADNSNLRQESAKLQEGWQEYVPPAKRNKNATLKIYRENAEAPAGVIIEAKVFKQNDWNEETHKYDRLVYSIKLRLDDASIKDIKLDAKQLSEIREIEKIEIIKEDRRTLRKVEGYVTVPDRDKAGFPKRVLSGSGYGSNIGSVQVLLEVFAVKSIVTVKRKNGQEFQMDADYLNI